ncbi:MAG: hypothetical protein HRU14_12300 [Planctomycetes bacterium]|nr:hypothetical protein [Planctomycetota bacterium]
MTSTCMLLTASLLTVVLPFSGPVSPPSAPDHQSAVRGPFSVELPVAGLKPEHQPELEKVLGRAFGRDILELKCAPGRLSFYFGGKGPKSLLRLSDLKAALSQTGLKLDRRSWILMEQEVGLYVSAAEGIGDGALKKLLEGIGDAQVEVLGMLLDGSRACVVVELDGELAFDRLEKALGSGTVAITNLAWGHWKYGWGITGEGDHGHRHRVGARLKVKDKK